MIGAALESLVLRSPEFDERTRLRAAGFEQAREFVGHHGCVQRQIVIPTTDVPEP